MNYMVIRGETTQRIHLDEIAVLVIENTAVSITGCLLEALIERKIKVIFCDSKHNPSAELVPHHGCHDSSSKIRAQIVWPAEIKALIWQKIVIEKIRQQADFLLDLGHKKESDLLRSYMDQVTPTDETNREGHAAKVYFNAVFGMDFSREQDNDINSALNYGYSILLSAFNREIAACGYLTQLGIFHDNVFNHYNLACDLMEPYRILLDRMVYDLKPGDLKTKEKHTLCRLLEQMIYIANSKQFVLNAIRIYTHSVLEALCKGDPNLIQHYRYFRNN